MRYEIEDIQGFNGPKIITCQRFADNRGAFMETFDKSFFERELGFSPVQENTSTSMYGVIRGLHFQESPFEQAKLISVVSGEIMDVAVDMRRGSGTYGKWFKVRLSACAPDQDVALRYVLVPKGFAHGFCVLSYGGAVVNYKVDEVYSPDHQGGMHWNQLPIGWGLPVSFPILSEKDMNLSVFKF